MFADTFNIRALTRHYKGINALADTFALAEGRIRLAFMLGMEIERERLYRSNGLAPVIFRTLDQAGNIRTEMMSGDASPGCGLSPEAIMSLRPEAERQYQAEVARTCAALRGDDADISASDILATRPADAPVVDMKDFRAWKNARDAFRRAAKAKAFAPAAPEYDADAFRRQIAQSVEGLLAEQMEQRVRLVSLVSRHAEELFGAGNTAAREDAVCALLLERPARKYVATDDKVRLRDARAVLFPGGGGTDPVPERISAMIADYDRFANDLRWRSGIALLSNAQKEETLDACRMYMLRGIDASSAFAQSLALAARQTYDMIFTDLFCSRDLKERYACKV